MPVVVIVGVLVWRGDALPDRAAVAGQRLPPSPEPRHLARLDRRARRRGGGRAADLRRRHRQALIVSMVAALLALSVVVVTGLQRPDLAGPAGLRRRRRVRCRSSLAERRLAVPARPASLAAAVAVLLGVLVGLPATRVRGMSLAVATLAMAVAIEQLVLASPAVSGGAGRRVGAPPGPVRHRRRDQRPGRRQLPPGVRVRGARRPRRSPASSWPTCAATAPACAGWRCGPTSGPRPRAGIDVTRAKLGAFAVSSALAGLAGVLLAFSATTLSPTSFLVIGALVALALTYLAGVSSIARRPGRRRPGPGRASSRRCSTAARSGDARPPTCFAISGLVLIVIAIVAPEGITGLVRRQVARLRRPREART